MTKRALVLLMALVLSVILAACGGSEPNDTTVGVTENPADGTVSNPTDISPTEESGAETAPTQELTTLVASNPTAVASGITPEEAVIIANIEAADAIEGERLYTGALVPACTTCHLEADSTVRQVAPSLIGFSEVAGTRVEGQDAYTYAYNSIRYANDHVVDGYQANVMPVYDGILTDQEVYDLIAYIWTLEAE